MPDKADTRTYERALSINDSEGNSDASNKLYQEAAQDGLPAISKKSNSDQNEKPKITIDQSMKNDQLMREIHDLLEKAADRPSQESDKDSGSKAEERRPMSTAKEGTDKAQINARDLDKSTTPQDSDRLPTLEDSSQLPGILHGAPVKPAESGAKSHLPEAKSSSSSPQASADSYLSIPPLPTFQKDKP